MRFFGRKSGESGAKNPQSGANSFSSSSAQSESQGSQSDVIVPIVNLTEQRLLDWKAGGLTVDDDNGGAGVVGGGGAAVGVANGGGANGAANGVGTNGWKNSASPPRIHSTSPNNLILLIERCQWAAASQRAQTHEHEVKQLVKLRKTTKNAHVGSSSSSASSSSSKS